MTTASKPSRRRKWLIIAGSLAFLLIAGWFVLTSGPVIKALVLPRVASALHADLTVNSVSLSPFSRVELTGAKLAPVGGKPIVEAGNIRVKYHLMKLIGGNIAVDDIELDQPRITVRQRADGGTDLGDWLSKLSTGERKAPTAPAGVASGKPLQVSVGSVAIKNATLQFESTHADGSVTQIGVDSLDVTLDQVRNGTGSHARVGGVIKVESLKPNGAVTDSLEAKFDLDGQASLQTNLMPSSANVKLTATITQATGRFAKESGVTAELTARGSMTKLDELALAFRQNGKPAGAIHANGTYDQATGNGAFDLGITNLPPVLLELAEKSGGPAFELGGFTSTNHIAITGRGGTITATGGLALGGLVARNASGVTPRLDVALNYGTELQPETGRALVSAFDMNAKQAGQPLLNAQINRPFHVTWTGARAVDDGTRFSIVLTNLDLGAWRPLTGPQPLAGIASMTASATSGNSGKQLGLRLNAALDRAVLALSTNRVDQLGAALNLSADIQSFNDLHLSQFTAKLTRANQPVIDWSASGTGAVAASSVDLKTRLNINLPELTALAGHPPITIRNGSLTFDGSVNYATNHSGTAGTLRLDGFNGDLAGATLAQVAVAAPVQVDLAGHSLSWKIDPLKITENGKPALEFNSDGQLELSTMTGNVKLALPLINEQLVNPFLSVYSPQQKLRSAQAAVNVNGTLQADGRQSWALESHSTNIVLVATNGALVTPPLATHANLDLDFNSKEQSVTIKRWEGTLFSDGKSSGQFNSSGDIRLKDGQATLNVKVTGINENALRPVAPLLIGDRKLDQARLEASIDVDYAKIKPSRVQASIDLTDVKITDPTGRFPQTPQSIKADFDASIVSNRLDIADSRLQMTPTSVARNLIQLTGWLDYANTSAIKGDLALRSPGFDATPYYSLLTKTGGTNAPAGKAGPAAPAPTPRESTSAPMNLPVDKIDLALDVRDFHLGELTITNWLAQGTVRSNSLDLGKFSLLLNDAPVNARMQATNDNRGTRYQLAAEVEALPLEPFMHTFKPDFKGRVQGSLYTAIHLRGDAPPGTNLVPASVGDIYLGVTNANYEAFSKRWQSMLRPVGLLLQTPELFSSPVSWAYLHTALTNRTLNITNLTIISDAYVLDASTAVPLDNDPAASKIPRTPVNLYLSRNLVTQLGILKNASTNQAARFVELPVFIHVGGTLGDPQLETDKLKLTGMTIGKAADFVGGSAGDVLRKAGGVTEGLGDFLSGKKASTGGEKQGGNVVGKGIGGLFDAVGNVLGGTGKAVEKGTGVVSGTKPVEQDVLASRMAAFDWPRVFTNAPNALPARP